MYLYISFSTVSDHDSLSLRAALTEETIDERQELQPKSTTSLRRSFIPKMPSFRCVIGDPMPSCVCVGGGVGSSKCSVNLFVFKTVALKLQELQEL